MENTNKTTKTKATKKDDFEFIQNVSSKGNEKDAKQEAISDDSSEYEDGNSSMMNMSLDFANDDSVIMNPNRPMEIKDPKDNIS